MGGCRVDRKVRELKVFQEEEVGTEEVDSLGGGAVAGRAGTGAPLVPETERTKENSQQPSKWNEGPLAVRIRSGDGKEHAKCLASCSET